MFHHARSIMTSYITAKNCQMIGWSLSFAKQPQSVFLSPESIHFHHSSSTGHLSTTVLFDLASVAAGAHLWVRLACPESGTRTVVSDTLLELDAELMHTVRAPTAHSVWHRSHHAPHTGAVFPGPFCVERAKSRLRSAYIDVTQSDTCLWSVQCHRLTAAKVACLRCSRASFSPNSSTVNLVHWCASRIVRDVFLIWTWFDSYLIFINYFRNRISCGK